MEMPSKDFFALSRAIADGDVTKVRRYLKKVKPDAWPGNSYGDSVLMVAIDSGAELEVLRLLIEEGGADVHFKSPRGRTATSTARKRGRKDVLALLAGKPVPPAAPKRTLAPRPSLRGDWLVWGHELERGGAMLDGLTGYRQDYKLLYGEPVLHEFPKKARYPLVASSDLSGPRKPKKNYRPVMTDSLPNTDSNLVLSERVVDVLRAHRVEGVEFIPVTLVGLDKKLRAERYFIVNPVGLVDAIDPKKTRASWTRDRARILGISRLVLDKKKLPKDRALIRLDKRSSLILARRELAEAVLALEPTGVRFEEIADHSDT